MKKLYSAIYKEFLLLINDKIGLSMMFFLPILLVVIITVIQNSAVKIVNDNNIALLVLDKDQSHLSQEFIKELKKSEMFSIKKIQNIKLFDLKKQLLESNDIPFALYIPTSFGNSIQRNSQQSIDQLINEINSIENNVENTTLSERKVQLYFNPIVQKNFYESIFQVINTLAIKIQSKVLITKLNEALGLKKNALSIADDWSTQKVELKGCGGDTTLQSIPNVSQHNVPAWSIFAVFFMVVSVAGNFVRERNNGSFDRLLTMPTSFMLILFSKIILFCLVSMVQIAVIFILSQLLFPFLSLPTLNFPPRVDTLLFAVFLCGLSAVIYSLLIGTYSKTVEQANGFGALSVIIFAVIGGIWVPFYILPDYLKFIGKFSPLYWCMECFYVLFLKNASWTEMFFPILVLLLMNISFVGLITYKLYQLGYIKKR